LYKADVSALALEATLTAMKGATFNGTTDSLEALRNRGDAAWITATGFSTHSAADVVSELDMEYCGVSIYGFSIQSFSTDTDLFDQDNFTGENYYTTSSGITFTQSNGRFTFSSAGTYYIKVSTQVSTSNGRVDLYVNYDGSVKGRSQTERDNTTSQVSLEMILTAAASGYVNFLVDPQTGSESIFQGSQAIIYKLLGT